MHWLYYDQNSPKKLEEAGATYDSTCGYNDAVGYRAGTTQVHKPLSATHLLELPLHVMDTALFYPSRMELSPARAASVLRPDPGKCGSVWRRRDRKLARPQPGAGAALGRALPRPAGQHEEPRRVVCHRRPGRSLVSQAPLGNIRDRSLPIPAPCRVNLPAGNSDGLPAIEVANLPARLRCCKGLAHFVAIRRCGNQESTGIQGNAPDWQIMNMSSPQTH